MSTIVIGGGSGLIGNRLSEWLEKEGHKVYHYSRRARPDARFRTFQWDVSAGQLDPTPLQEADVVINLAGAGIADQRWTQRRKKVIIDSRVQSTELLLSEMQQLDHPPKVFLSASAIGFYGDRGDEQLTEESGPGNGFLAESCIAWERSIEKVAQTGIRTAWFRTGIVLSTKDGALPKMIQPARFGLGTYFGTGDQWFSWIHIDDMCKMYLHAIGDDAIRGAYNGVAPNPLTNLEFTRQLMKALEKNGPALPAPAFILRIAMGEMADVVLNSNRVSADKILATGFSFDYPDLIPAIQHLVDRKV